MDGAAVAACRGSVPRQLIITAISERESSPNAANVMGRRNSTEEICSFHTTIDPHRSGTVQKKKRKREISLKY
jgi:hypothetical protein